MPHVSSQQTVLPFPRRLNIEQSDDPVRGYLMVRMPEGPPLYFDDDKEEAIKKVNEALFASRITTREAVRLKEDLQIAFSGNHTDRA